MGVRTCPRRRGLRAAPARGDPGQGRLGPLRFADHLRGLADGVLAQPEDLDGQHHAVPPVRRPHGSGAGPARLPWTLGAALLGPAALVLPPVVGGLALLYTFGRKGLLGGAMDVIGVQVAFSTIAVVMAQTFVAMPFLVVTLEGALRTSGQRYEVVAASLGAGPTTVFRRITVPLVLPGLVSGAVLSFARSLGEFGATITFAGSLRGRTRTLPLEIYLQRETDPDAAVALALVLVVVAVVVIGVARQRRGVL